VTTGRHDHRYRADAQQWRNSPRAQISTGHGARHPLIVPYILRLGTPTGELPDLTDAHCFVALHA